jgi:hypothetical protein
MTKVVGMLVALVAFCALPAVAFAGGDNVSSGNTQNGSIDQDATGGDGGSGGDGGDAGNQGAIIQQNAGRDANASIDQSQSFGGGDVDNNGGGNGGGGGGDFDDDDFDDDDNVGGGDFNGDDDDVSGDDDDVTTSGDVSGGIGGGSQTVTLARTGFDAWILALLGGLSLAGGLGLLAAQRRGRTNP